MLARIKRLYGAMLAAWAEPKPPTPVQDNFDPLDHRQYSDSDFGIGGFDKFFMNMPTVNDYPLAEVAKTPSKPKGGFAHDAAIAFAMDDGAGNPTMKTVGGQFAYQVPYGIQNWYAAQSFIGWQACALIAQHWLVDKACRQAGEDAVRNGYEITVGDGTEVSSEIMDQIRQIDGTFEIQKHMRDAVYWNNVFGIRVVMFDIESDDPEFYEKPFNIDGVTKGSYKGIRQIDPYWMTPLLTIEGSSDPTNRHFYDPEFWVISGRKYHRTHLIILRGTEPADVLKPLYIYGGIPLVQRIYERVYAAERVANEAPLLATEKRTTALHVDLKKLAMNQQAFENRLMQWVHYRDNHQIKVLGLDETVEQFDTSLSDFDSLIAGQYSLVAAIAKVPYTKLMQTSPSGFQSTGEFELKSYSQELEGIQVNDCGPLLKRHHELVVRSMGYEFNVTHTWRPTDAHTAKEKAEINKMNVDSGIALVNAGIISADEERQRLRDDPLSGYGVLSDSEDGEAETELFNVELLKAEGQKEKGEAAIEQTGQSNKMVGEGDDIEGGENLNELIEKLKVIVNPTHSYPEQESPLSEQFEENVDSPASSSPEGSLARLQSERTLTQLVGHLATLIVDPSPTSEPGIGDFDGVSDEDLGQLVEVLKKAVAKRSKPVESRQEPLMGENQHSASGSLLNVNNEEIRSGENGESSQEPLKVGFVRPGVKGSVKPSIKPSVIGMLGEHETVNTASQAVATDAALLEESRSPTEAIAKPVVVEEPGIEDGHITALEAERDNPTPTTAISNEGGSIEVVKDSEKLSESAFIENYPSIAEALGVKKGE